MLSPVKGLVHNRNRVDLCKPPAVSTITTILTLQDVPMEAVLGSKTINDNWEGAIPFKIILYYILIR